MLYDATTTPAAPLPGHAIPYALSPAEIQQFLKDNAGDPTLSNYLWTKQPAYGVIVTQGYGQLLVWFDAVGVLHVIDVTNMSIAQQVQQAPYESPDSSVVDNITNQVQQLIQSLPSLSSLGEFALLAIAGIALIFYFQRR